MKWLLIAAIRLYQNALRPHLGRVCIFQESCSRAVLERTQRLGFVAGISELTVRLKQCRPGYRPLDIFSKDGERLFVLADLTIVKASCLSRHVRAEFSRVGGP